MTETKAQFAKRLGVNKSTVTRYGQAGRLVLAPNGKVKVEDSLRLIASTKGARLDVSEKHGQLPSQVPENGSETILDDDMSATVALVGMDRATLKAQTLTYGNKMLELEAAKAEGKALDKDDFLKQVGLNGRSFRVGMERLIDNLAPVLINVHGYEARLATIGGAVNAEFGVN
jgi:hypothetical protein